MRRTRRFYGVLAGVIILIFVFVPFMQTITRNAGYGSQDVGWVSPSFAFFQCGTAIGGYSLQVPSGGTVGGPEPFWASNSIWNCEYPHL